MYEADAYGSLRQLSSRAGTPICGAALVPWSNEADAASFYVTTRAIRYGTTFAEELPDFSLSAQSLAAGGRLFAGMSAQRSRLASKVWLNFEPYPDSARRLFGERDTITYFIPGNPYRAPVLQLRLLPSALSWSLNPPTAYPEFGFNFNSFGQPSLSPQGDRVVFPLERNGYSHDPYGSIAPAVRTSASLEILSGSAQTTIPLSNTAVDTRAVFASSGRSAWHPAGERFAFYAPTVIRDIGGYYLASSVRANLLLVTFGGGAPTTTEALSEQLRWPISATWSDEGERLTLIDARVDSVAITPNERLGLTDCRSRTFHANTSRQLTLIRTSPMDAHICAPTATYDEPLLDASGRAGYWCLVWSPCANGGSGGSGGGGGGGGGGMEGSIVRRREADAPARYWMRGPQRRGLPPRGARGLAFPNF